MGTIHSGSEDCIIVAGPASAISMLDSLIYQYKQQAEVMLKINEDVPAQNQIQEWAEYAKAILVIFKRSRAPSTIVSGPLLFKKNGIPVPIGILPYTNDNAIRLFAAATEKVYNRTFIQDNTSIALLGQWENRYLYLLKRIGHVLTKEGTQPKLPTFFWSSDNIIREDMIRGIHLGLSAAIYLGHGRPNGWVGYLGTRAHHFNEFEGEPLGAMLSLTCHTANRWNTGLSFTEAIPLMGKAAAAFGAVGKTLHINNIRLGVRMSLALRSGMQRLDQLLIASLPDRKDVYKDYRIIGDPLAPLSAHPQATENALQLEKEVILPLTKV